MSRCFPYPPPGYSGKRACNEALIESIKLQREREREKAKAERKKEKKREKKEKKREKKEKSKPKPIEVGHDEKAHKVKKTWADLKEEYNNKRKDYEAEQLERSGLTEEHGQPICSQNPSYSSDSTQNSNKRKRHPSFANDSSSNGNVLRIRLPLQKHKEPDGSASKEQLCSTSGRIDLPSQHNIEIVPLRTDNLVQRLPPRPDKELSCSTFGKIEIFVQEKARIAPGSTSFERKTQKLNSVYKGLIEKWAPPVLQSEPNFDDQEWLFGREHQEEHREKRFRSSSSDISSCGSSTLWPPRAQYLPEADIYALPYTLYL